MAFMRGKDEQWGEPCSRRPLPDQSPAHARYSEDKTRHGYALLRWGKGS